MPRLTISLSQARHRALKEAAARRGQTIGSLIEDCLDQAGIKSTEEVLEILRRAGVHSELDEAGAMALAIRETRAVRRATRR